MKLSKKIIISNFDNYVYIFLSTKFNVKHHVGQMCCPYFYNFSRLLKFISLLCMVYDR